MLFAYHIRLFFPKKIAVYDKQKAKELKARLNGKADLVAGCEGVKEIASMDEVDIVVVAISGSVGLEPAVAAINAGKRLAIANKEVLVSGGKYIIELAREKRAELIPVDSEHSAIFQCLKNEKKEYVKRIVITASGGPFSGFSKEKLKQVSLEEALRHPTYSMGKKITVDSSTLMNKGLEVIEAYFLFGISARDIEVVVHPQSFVHSFVEFSDGSILAQTGKPDMRVPIRYALTYPERAGTAEESIDFTKLLKWEFFPPDLDNFPCLRLAYQALEEGGSMPCYMNGANEMLVDRFLNKEITWNDISAKLEKLMASHKTENMLNLGDILEIDKKAKAEARII